MTRTTTGSMCIGCSGGQALLGQGLPVPARHGGDRGPWTNPHLPDLTSLAEKADAGTRAFVLRSISALDARLPTPAFIAQAVTGVFLIWLRGWSFFSTGWLVIGVALYIAMVVTAMAAYAPAFQRQQMLADAVAADPADVETAGAYEVAARRSTTYGIVVTALTVVIVFLMVWKPNLW
jgi:uncharacterized membrane protein